MSAMVEIRKRSWSPENDFQGLKDAFCAQKLLLRKLYAELDKEREASASAASEALSMIWRLQEEKAAAKLEAIHYKRIAENNVSHVEECLAFYEDVVYCKDMEIASLGYQIQAYRYKLLSTGCCDLDFFEKKLAESLRLPKNNLLNGNIRVKRFSSLPAMGGKDSSHLELPLGRDFSAIDESAWTLESVEESEYQKYNVQSSDLEKNSAGDIDSCCECIKLNEEVKETPDYRYVSKDRYETMKGGYEWHGSTSISPKEQFLSSELSWDNGVPHNVPWPSVVKDIFEIWQYNETCKATITEMEESTRLILENDRLRKPDVLSEKTFMLEADAETELSLGCKSSPKSIFDTKYQAVIQKLSPSIEILEEERKNKGQIMTEAGGEQLQAISKQPNLIHSDAECSSARKSSAPRNSVLIPLMEAMLHFWL